MAITTRFSTDNGIRRLLSAPLDLGRLPPARDRPLAEATPQERDLFDGYVSLLRLAYTSAEQWWESTIAAQEERGLSREDAVVESFDRRLAGPASHPMVVWIVREFWLLAVRDAPSLRPESVLLRWLIEAGETELVRLVACMPYWPIGLDADGDWC